MMRRRTLIAALFATMLFASPALALAQTTNPAGQDVLNFLRATAERGGLKDAKVQDPASSEDQVLNIIGTIINVILGFVGIIFFIQLFWAGARWMTSGGSDEVIKESKDTIKASIIGVVIALAAFVITNFVLNQVGRVTQSAEQLGRCTYFDSNGGEQCSVTPKSKCSNSSLGTDVSGASWDPGVNCDGNSI